MFFFKNSPIKSPDAYCKLFWFFSLLSLHFNSIHFLIIHLTLSRFRSFKILKVYTLNLLSWFSVFLLKTNQLYLWKNFILKKSRIFRCFFTSSLSFFFSFYFFIYFGFAGSPLLLGLFPRCTEQGLPSGSVCGLLTAVAFLVWHSGSRTCGLQ